MTYTREIIPKDCLLCDVCNKQLSDSDFKASEDSTWYEGWLYCKSCESKYSEATGGMVKVMDIKKDQDLSKTDLAQPMVFESW